MYTDTFGFVGSTECVRFEGGVIEPLETHASAAHEVSGAANPDGFLYPPVIATHRSVGRLTDERWEEVPQSRRGASLQSLPASHRLSLDIANGPAEAQRRGAAGFLIHLFGFLHGVRCQFYDWFIDGRAQVKPDSDHWPPSARQVANVLTTAYREWTTWTPRRKQVVTNALFLHGRASACEFVWERFQNQYMVFDAACSLVELPSRARGRVPHRDRIAALCEFFSIDTTGANLQAIVDLRNNLLHEALWCDGMPGDAGSDLAWNSYLDLRAISIRVVLGALGVRGEYVSSSFAHRCTSAFKID